MIDPKLGLRPYTPHLCGPCHRAKGGSGLPSMAIPARPDLDDRGGIVGICDGIDDKPHGVHLDHQGEPFSAECLEQIRASRAKWDENVKAGHTLMTMAKA